MVSCRLTLRACAILIAQQQNRSLPFIQSRLCSCVGQLLRLSTIGFVCISLPISASEPQTNTPKTLVSVVQQVLDSNPEVQGKLAAFNAARAEKQAAWGAHLPRGDLRTGSGRSTIDPDAKDGNSISYSRTTTSLTLSQLIFDGFVTANDIRRLGYTRAMRYFELLDSAETTSAEAVKMFGEITRYRKLTSISEQNYAQHKFVHDQIKSRVASGVGRRVDLELATGRMALAESNYLNDLANLHDAMAGYQRLVGELPPNQLADLPDLNAQIPLSSKNAVLFAGQRNAGLRAAMEGVQAAQAQARMRQGLFLPRVELRLNAERDSNYLGQYARSNNTSEVVVQWNFLNGGGDIARVRQFSELLNVAKEVRDKTCRDLRQSVQSAWNNQRKLSAQLELLDIHQRTTEAARNAFKAQFELGQRTLLDLLDTENELFSAKRNRINGGIDLFQSQARLLALMGRLTQYLSVRELNVDAPSEITEVMNEDSQDYCAADVPPSSVVDRDDLDARAARINLEINTPKNLQPPTPTPAGAAAWGVAPSTPVTPTSSATVTPITPAPAPSATELPPAMPAPRTTLPVSGAEGVRMALDRWQQALARQEASIFVSSYAPDFQPEFGLSRDEWELARARRMTASKPQEVVLTHVKIEEQPEGVEVRFTQRVKTAAQRGYELKKQQVWKQYGGQWLIQEERTEQ